jgi:acyl carrier protein
MECTRHTQLTKATTKQTLETGRKTMRNNESVVSEITPILTEVLGIDADRVTPSARFEEDLGGSSIDLLDFAFRCQKQFGIRLDFQDLIDPTEIETDASGLLTPESLSRLKERLPFLDYSEFERHPQKTQITRTITVNSLAHFICDALAAKEQNAIR